MKDMESARGLYYTGYGCVSRTDSVSLAYGVPITGIICPAGTVDPVEFSVGVAHERNSGEATIIVRRNSLILHLFRRPHEREVRELFERYWLGYNRLGGEYIDEMNRAVNLCVERAGVSYTEIDGWSDDKAEAFWDNPQEFLSSEEIPPLPLVRPVGFEQMILQRFPDLLQ